ncbi:hypothetical protein COY32_02645, partial [candidate division WWE3 bacterium CG_4_10_14_0_2_um_filter_41_14]
MIIEGNVGIGTTSPGALLDVAGTIISGINGSISGRTTYHSTYGFSGESPYIGTNVRGLVIAHPKTSTNDTNIRLVTGSTNRLVVGADVQGGNVGIGPDTVPDYFFDVQGIMNVDSSVYLASTTGNVGIGTTAPGAKLDVNGKIALSGSISLYNAQATNSFSGSLFVGDGGAGLLHTAGSDGYYNTGLGIGALFSNTEGNSNTAAGYKSLYNNTTGDNNTAVGKQALFANIGGYDNTAIGYYALSSNTTGYHNTALGDTGLYNNIAGNNNTSTGYGALFLNSAGNNNTANGVFALNNTTGSDNTATGYGALFFNSSGAKNSAYGMYSLMSNTSGYNNAAIGYSAGEYIANGSTGNSTSNNSLYLGYGTRALANGDTNEIVIGASAIGNGSNSVTLGNDSITKTILRGNVGIGTTAPGKLLNVGNSSTAGNPFRAGVRIQGGGNTAGNWATWDFEVGATSVGDSAQQTELLRLSSNTVSNVMTWERSTGNVGIGTTAPVSKLEVSGSISVLTGARYFTIGDSTGHANERAVWRYNGSSTTAQLYATTGVNLSLGSGGSTDWLFVKSGGNVGIGTTGPNSRLTANTASPSANALLFNIQNTGANVFSVDAEGDYFFDGTGSSPAADVAEIYPTEETDMKPGEIVSLTVQNAGDAGASVAPLQVGRSAIANDPNLLGVVTTKPALLM